MSIQLQIGKSYRRADGVVEYIAGPTRDNPAWVWSRAGNWYVQATGQLLNYSPTSGHVPFPEGNWRNLVEEV